MPIAFPCNPRGVNANNAHCNDRNSNHDHDHQQDHNYQNNQDNRSNQQHNHHYPTRSQQQREENHQQQEPSDNCSQCMTNHSKSNDEIFALEEKHNINTNDQDIITKQDYVPEIAIGVLADVVTKRYKYLQALIDSGSSSSIICKSSMPDPTKKKIKDDPSGETKWTTKGGTYITTGEANIWFQLTEFAPSHLFKHKFKVDRDAKSASYDIILGRNAMKELQFNLLYSENVPKIRFEQEVEIDCKPHGFWSGSRLHQVYFQAHQSTIDKAEEEFLEKQCFSQAQYQAADLRKCLPNHLSSQDKEKLYALLDKHRFLFKGTLGLLPTKPVHVEIKSNAKPFHGCAFSVPKAYESMIRNEVKCLCCLNVLRRCNESEWAAPSFGTPKKNGQIRFISLLTPLTALTKKNVKFEWTKEHQQAFDLLKNSLTRKVVLAYPDFLVPFEIYTDDSKYQIGSVITQKDKPLAFYSRKLTDPHTRHTVTELELLAIVEMLHEYKCILLGHLITIYMDHKNLTFSNFTTDCVTRWQLIVEEYSPKIVYLPGKRNIIADALSCLPKLNDLHDESTFLEEIFALDEQTDTFPIAFDVISKEQLADNKIQWCITNNDPDFKMRIIQ
jgi:hypothetical protein